MEVGFFLLLSLLLSGFRSRGRWQNAGGVQPNIPKRSTCLGTELIHSSPLIMWVYLHEVVVHHHRQVVGREPVALEDHLVVNGGPVLADLPPEQVGEDTLPLQGGLHPDDVGLAPPHPVRGLPGGYLPAVPVVTPVRVTPGRLFLSGRLQPLPGAEAGVAWPISSSMSTWLL
jgi:hypothetical protein